MAKLSNKDLQVTFLTQGFNAVRDILATHKNPAYHADKLYDFLADHDLGDQRRADLDALDAYRSSMKGARSGRGRGRRQPEIGETRAYKIQENSTTGQLFITLPIPSDAISVMKGDSVAVHFDDGQITIK